MKRILFVIYYLLINYMVKSQEITFYEMLERLENNYSFEYFSNYNLNKKTFPGFDFESFAPIIGETSNCKFDVYSLDNEIVKVVLISKKHKFTIIQIAKFDSLSFFSIYLNDKEYPVYINGKEKTNRGQFLDGLIVYNKTINKCFYFNCYEIIGQHKLINENDEIISGEYYINPFIKASSVNSIFLLDKNLDATDRLNFYEGICVSFSKISKKSNVFSEQINVLVDEKPYYLKDIKLKSLYSQFEMGVARKVGLYGTIYPERYDDYPIYFYASLKYK